MSAAATHSQLKPPVGPKDHVEGSPDAVVTLVEYGDYECPHCGHADSIVKRLQKRFGHRLRFIFRNFPLGEIHPHAVDAAELAEAAALQGKFWPMHDLLFEHQDALEREDGMRYAQSLHLDLPKLEAALEGDDLSERVRADFNGGVRSGVNGTPTFFINGHRFDGAWPEEDAFADALEAAAAAPAPSGGGHGSTSGQG